ncbi:MAG: hypothetical protein ACREQK_08870 [Candidatus Binatia bacterium]
MTKKEALEFVEKFGIVLESAQGPVPNLAAVIAGEGMRGSWWAHKKSREIYLVTRGVRESDQVLVCRLLEGKMTYVHRRLWPALVRISRKIPKVQLTAIHEVHLEGGKHQIVETPFPHWVPEEVGEQAKKLSERQAESAVEETVPFFFSR